VEVASALQQLATEQRLSSDTSRRLRVSYRRQAAHMRDPFKRAVFCLLAKCDVHLDHPDVATTTDDYLWIKLTQVDRDVTEAAPPSGPQQDVLSLATLQNLLCKQYGEAHFNAQEQPLLYATVLLLTGQFEVVVEFLHRATSLPQALHMALSLHHARLLSLPPAPNAPLLTTAPHPALNFARLVLLYTRRFEATHPNETLHYYFLLRDIKTAQGDDLFLSCVSELALSSRCLEEVLGSLSADGVRTPGLVDAFDVDRVEITSLVARDAEKRGLHEDAAKLYDLAGSHEKALGLLNKMLAQVVHKQSSAQTGERERIMQLACAIGIRYRQHGHSALQQTATTMHLLLDLATVFDLHHSQMFQESLDVIRRLGVIATTPQEVDTRVRGLSALAPQVRDTMPHLLLAAITATHKLYQDQPDPGLALQAKAIVTFAGMMPLRLHADVNARLVQLEALIN